MLDKFGFLSTVPRRVEMAHELHRKLDRLRLLTEAIATEASSLPGRRG